MIIQSFRIQFYVHLLASLLVVSILGCDKEPAPKSALPSSKIEAATPFAVYVASGSVYAGLGVTPSTASQTISQYDENGNFVKVLRDFVASPGDTPVALADYNANFILALIENTGSRRVELIAKDGSSYSTLFANTALSGVLRTLLFDYSGGLLISESSGIEKFTTAGVRIQMGANSYVQNPAGSCATVTNLISDITLSPDQNIIAANAFTAASTNNKLVMINKAGYGVAGDCLSAQAAPSTSHFPTALLMHSSGHLLAAYSNNTGPIFQIYSYPIDGVSFGTPVVALNNISLSQAVSRMVEMPDGEILIANAHSNFNNIDRYSYDPNTGTLSLVGNFIRASVFTRSISSVLIVQ